ncbi:alpha/beta fold hydrolase [Limnoglobus roseus]|uniref:Lysophospholipase n=1 Tax=Limnoglobus roseus TaxID=2598579 RepID=A0A5C1APZ6_9BACT|nr:alpha/beta fold hydrolase [Limnoglobus roseus]QEL20096.1 lysophospholipase [Limnoglobus roseus]
MNDPLPCELRTFRSSDGYRWYYRHYPATGRPRGRVIFVHGIRSHGGWYGRSCAEIAAAGYDVDFLDRRGSGLNTAARGDTPNFRRLLDDIAEFVLELRQSRPWLPTHLAGVSWGGKLAVGLQYRRPGLVDSLSLLCPGLCPKVSPPLGQRIAIARARVRNPSRLFPIPLNDPELFTASPDWQRFLANEPHDLRFATARFLFSSVSLDLYLKRAAKRVTLPTLLMLAGEDRVIDNALTRRAVEAFPAKRKHVLEYPAAHHTLEFEPPGHPFVRDLLAWLET